MKKYKIIQIGILIAVLLIVTRQVNAQDVAVLGSESNPAFTADVQTKLLGTGQFTTVDILDVRTTTPTLVQLQAYHAVLIWSDAGYADPVILGNNLADYHDGCGGVVTAIFERHLIAGGNLLGRLGDRNLQHICRGRLPYLKSDPRHGTRSGPSGDGRRYYIWWINH